MAYETIRTDIQADWIGLHITLVERSDRGPMRAVATGRRRRPVGSYYSLKNGEGVPWESRNELAALYHAEVRADVVSYRTQPHTWEFKHNGQRLRFTPDLELHLENGGVEIIEIKGEYDASADPTYAWKVDLVASICPRLGWSFRLIERAELLANPTFKAVEEVQSYRRTAVTPSDIMLVSQTLSESDQLTLGEVASAFANTLVGYAKIYAMAVRRLVVIDFSNGLSPKSPVRLAAGRTLLA